MNGMCSLCHQPMMKDAIESLKYENSALRSALEKARGTLNDIHVECEQIHGEVVVAWVQKLIEKTLIETRINPPAIPWQPAREKGHAGDDPDRCPICRGKEEYYDQMARDWTCDCHKKPASGKEKP